MTLHVEGYQGNEFPLPNLEGVSAVDFKNQGFVNILKDGGLRNQRKKPRTIMLDTEVEERDNSFDMDKANQDVIDSLRRLRKSPVKTLLPI